MRDERFILNLDLETTDRVGDTGTHRIRKFEHGITGLLQKPGDSSLVIWTPNACPVRMTWKLVCSNREVVVNQILAGSRLLLEYCEGLSGRVKNGRRSGGPFTVQGEVVQFRVVWLEP